MRHLTTLRYIDAVVREKSIRRAAEKMAITATALNRRILAIEDEMGQKLFERLPTGVRLNAAGEIFIHHIRTQLSDLERVRSQIADLSGVRRGHVNIVSTGDALGDFLSVQIARYRTEYPAVTFHIFRNHGAEAEMALEEHRADIALIFEPVRSANFQVMTTVHQTIHCVMAHDHPLRDKSTIRLRDGIDYPVIMPEKTSGIRQLLDAGLMYKMLTVTPMIETDDFAFIHDYLRAEQQAIAFQIPVRLVRRNPQALIARPLDARDVASGILHIGHLQGRVLPVAAAKFLDHLIRAIEEQYPENANEAHLKTGE